MGHFLLDNSGNIITNGSSLFEMTFGSAEPTSGTFFYPWDWWLSDPGTDGDLTVGIINLPTDATDVEYKVDSGSWTSGGSTSGFTISGLTNNSAVLVYIRPVFAGGAGDYMLPKKGTPTSVSGSLIYADPTGGGDGSYGSPYTVSAAIAAASTGDRVVLKDGTYSTGTTINITSGGGYTIAAENPHAARIRGNILVAGTAANIIIRDLKIAPDSVSDPSFGNLVQVYSSADTIKFDNLLMHSLNDFSAYETWLDTDWETNARGMFEIANANTHTIVNCITQCGKEGFTGSGSARTYECNAIRDHCRDAMKVSDNDTVRYNWIANTMVTSGNHPDMMQSDVGADDVTIQNNICCEWLWGASQFSNLPAPATQGICVFNGTSDNWTVENNVVICSNLQAIAIYQGSNCTVRNNTVLSRLGTGNNPTINFVNEGSGNVSYNNIAAAHVGPSTSGSNTTIAIGDHATNFPGLTQGDARPSSGNANLTNGDASNDTATDLRGVTRDASTPARGAHETAYS